MSRRSGERVPIERVKAAWVRAMCEGGLHEYSLDVLKRCARGEEGLILHYGSPLGNRLIEIGHDL